jgi:protein-tyrosine-phosphatase
MKATRVLMVCTGNICRSPMAEVLVADYGLRRGRIIESRSASVLGLVDKPAHRNSQAVMRELGMDLSEHRSQPVTAELMDWADYVLGMEIRHSADLRERYPQHDDKILLLPSFGGMMEIEDPINRWRFRYRRCREEIKRCCEAFVDQLPPST